MKSCKDITLLIEKSKENKLSLKEKMQIKVHVTICKLCKNYKLDSAYLDRILTKITPKKLKLSEEEKLRLSSNVKERLK